MYKRQFLGTTNYVRPHAGPTYAKVMHPLRALLKTDAVFPPNAEQLAAIEAMKKLVAEDHLLAVPDEQAAIIAARAWNCGDPPAGIPYEAGRIHRRLPWEVFWVKRIVRVESCGC